MRTSRSQYYSDFDPRALGGCMLWIDANDTRSFTLSGSTVTAISDKSGSGTSITNITNTVTWSSTGLNSRPAFNITGGNLRGTFSTSVIASNFTYSMFSVVRANSTPGNGASFMGMFNPETNFTTNWVRVLAHLTVPNRYATMAYFQATSSNTSNAAQYTTPFLWESYYEGDQTGNSIVSLSNAANTSAVIPSRPTLSPTHFTIGTEWNSVDTWTRNLWPGTFSEVIVFNNILNPALRQLVEGYLAWKWGLQTSIVPATHPYRFMYPFIRPFTPADLTTACEFWFDAADTSTITSSGTTLTTWSNKGTSLGSNITVTSGTPTTGSATQNTLNCIELPTSNTVLQFTGAFPTQVRTRLFVIRPRVSTVPTPSIFIFYQNAVASSGNDLIVFNGNNVSEVASGVAFRLVGTLTSDQSNVFGVYTVRNASTTARNRVALNGTALALPTNTTAASYNTASTINYFNRRETGQAYSGAMDIGEFLSYNSQLSPVETIMLEGYLAWKWGLQSSLPTNHVFRLYPPVHPVFSPTLIANCGLWLDAADQSTITLSGNNISQWRDKSGNGRNTTTFWNAPTFSNNAVWFLSNQGLTTSPTLTASSTIESAFIVTRVFQQTTIANTLLGAANGNDGRQFRLTDTLRTLRQDIAGVLDTGATLPISNTHLVGFVRNGSTLIHYWNGNVHASTASATIGYTAGRTTSIGQRFGNFASEGLNGYIQEIIVYTAALTSNQRRQVEGHLAWKWGLQGQLPVTHPFREVKP